MEKRKIYVASSWRNDYQQLVVGILRGLGHDVYDFRHPSKDDHGFAWSEIDEDWERWTTDEYVKALEHPIAQRGYKNDFDAMKEADTCVLVLPCGRSAHTEAGWMKGMGKEVYIYSPVEQEPELMYKVFDRIISEEYVLQALFRFTESGPSGQGTYAISPQSTPDFTVNNSQPRYEFEAQLLNMMEVMCEQSLCPGRFEEWEKVKSQLIKNRRLKVE